MNPEAVTEHIVAWLRTYLEQSGMEGWVVGVSGGIDSAVTSTLCALTGAPTVCVEMPIHKRRSRCPARRSTSNRCALGILGCAGRRCR